MEYSYQARDNNGALRTGTVEATNEAAAYDTLSQHGLIVVKIFTATRVSRLENLKILDRIPAKEIVLFSRQFSTLINAKVPIVQSLKILRGQVSSGRFQATITEIAQRVESGDSLSSALARYPKIFSGLYINLVRAGEISGTLDNSLNYLADQLEKNNDLRSQIVGAMTYPIFVVGALFVVGILMFIYVLPPLVSILDQSGVTLPVTTQILIAVTNFIHQFWWLIILVVVGGSVSYAMYSATPGGRYIIDSIKIRLPIFGPIFKKIYMSRFSRNLATLVAGGIPIVKALESVGDIVGNQVYRQIIFEAANQVKNGKSIASSLVDRTEVPVIVSQMIQIGETTGRLQEILGKLANFYDKEVDQVLKNLTTLMEPIIMIILGLAVAVMVAGILLPIYNLASAS